MTDPSTRALTRLQPRGRHREPWGPGRGPSSLMARALQPLLGSLLLAVLLTTGAAAGPLRPDEVPAPLRPWVDWVIAGHEQETCPTLVGGSARGCVWPARLELSLDSETGRFTQVFFVDAASTVRLPGDSQHWPEDVELDGRPAPVVGGGSGPRLALEPGRHEVSGRFHWKELPQLLRVPPETGLISLTLDGQPVPFPRRDGEGRLWLREQVGRKSAAENRLTLQVHRHVVDEIPLQLTTDVQLQVSGESREARLGPVLPPGFVPLGVWSPLPARLEADGTLRIQVRPGRWQVRLTARREGRVSELTLPAVPPEGTEWDRSEIWAFEARPNLRLVDVEGVSPVDPSQTELPAEWRSLPTYLVAEGDTLRLVEKRRGSSGPLRDDLQLTRTWHLDFDGRGATVSDAITGTMRSTARLEMGPATRLGRAAVNGLDQPITRRVATEGETGAGIEVPLGHLNVDADSRVESGVRHLPAVGWDQDFSALAGQLQLPPGWKLLHVSGVDHASATWIGRWTLLDLFVVLLVAMAFLQLFGPAVGGLAAAALTLTYTEPGAPGFIWVGVLALEGLRRVVPAGRFATALLGLRAVTLAGLVLIAVPFALQQLQSGLFPALERPWAVVTDQQAGADEEVMSEMAAAPARKMRLDAPGLGRSGGVLELDSSSAPYGYSYAPDPKAQIPTGPGRPDWQWETVTLQWNGPVDRGQALRLWLLPPWATAALAFLRTALLLALVGVALGTARDMAARWWPRGSGASSSGTGTVAAALAAVVLAAAGAPAPAHAELPSQELLGELRTRLLEQPDCHPHCASIPRLALEATPQRLDLRMTVDVAAATAIPLPGGLDATEGFVPSSVLVNGTPASGLVRAEDGGLWLRLPPGSHRVHVRGSLPPRETVELPLPLRPHRAEAKVRGWELQGLHADGRTESALQMRRESSETDEREERFEPTAIPPFVTVTRDLSLGLSWQTQTTVERVAPAEAAIVIEVPLLRGESVTTPGIRVQNGMALVSLQPGQARAGWTSILPLADELVLIAPEGVPWTEVWRVDPSPVWHLEPSGIPWVEGPAEGLTRRREWRPWPGEQVTLAIERPEGLAGSTVTIDTSHLLVVPGLRATDSTLSLRLRSSQGGQHRVRLPEGAELMTLQLNGRDQPLRQEGRDVPLPLSPGVQTAQLSWRNAVGISLVTRTPDVDLGLPSVNHHVEVQMPQDRWALATSGARLGPAILFWPLLLLLGVLSFALGRLSLTPLRTHHWFLLGIGLSQAPLLASGCVVVWLLALGWRRERGASVASPIAFDLLQVELAALTMLALTALFFSIKQGLLGLPEMQIAGNGSTASLLRWYQDRVGAELPRMSVVSVSLWFYRLAMLAWALWVARALIGWLRWGWDCFSTGELWRPVRRKVVSHTETPPPTGFERKG